MLPRLTSADFDDTVASNTPTLVKFTADWCGPCKAIAPYLAEIATEFDGRMTVTEVDIDSEPALQERYGIRGVPTMILFTKGEVRTTMVGAAPKADIVNAFAPYV